MDSRADKSRLKDAQLGVGISEFIIRYAAADVHAVVITVLGYRARPDHRARWRGHPPGNWG